MLKGMYYKVSYEDSRDSFSAKRLSRVVPERHLASTITRLIDKGCVIVEVRQA